MHTGDPKPLENRFLHFVDVRDVADALLLVHEKPKASGRYICSPNPSSAPDVVRTNRSKLNTLITGHVHLCFGSFIEVAPDSLMHSKELKSLGWKYRTLEEILTDAIEFF
ncbi:hypothetical protein IEQ34_012309 [Dendrobium chrysotoxum]|uniref:Uncharacterized protein n=1 Tax=Dendrobium chrysotoxum TaxID=161865 RepID=A0AAV7GCK6_DENCH|nr:hypothetical protein IEQ34_012309 [Dendrobium chrysotoxum]